MSNFSQNLLFFVLLVSSFLSFVIYSIQAPLLPRQAHSVGASTAQMGLVFGAYELASLISRPIFGAYAGKLGRTRTISSGVFALGVSTILLGFVNDITTPNTFITVASILRIVESIGASAANVGIHSIVDVLFGENLGTAIVIMEGVHHVALAVGPYIGSWLYEIGGFTFPFLVLGGCVMLTGVVVTLLMSRCSNETESEEVKEFIGVSVVLSQRPILMNFSIVLLTAVQLGAILALLEIHLRQFNLSPTGVGLVFLIHGAVAAIVKPIASHFTGKVQIPESVPFFGGLFYFIAYTFLGPAPFSTLNPSLSLVVFSIVCLGIANSSNLTSGFMMALSEAKKAFPTTDEAGLSEVVSSLHISTMTTGFMIGPVMAGALYDYVGFPYTTVVLLLIATMQVTLIPVFMVYKSSQPSLLSEWKKVPTSEFQNMELEMDFVKEPLVRRRSSTTLKSD